MLYFVGFLLSVAFLVGPDELSLAVDTVWHQARQTRVVAVRLAGPDLKLPLQLPVKRRQSVDQVGHQDHEEQLVLVAIEHNNGPV